MSRFKLNAGEQKQFHVEHRFLRISYASHPVDISGSGLSSFVVKNREVIDFVNGGKTILFINRNEVSMVVEFSSEPVKVTGIDEVNLAEGASVTLAQGSVLDVGTVQLATDTELSVKPGSVISVDNLPVNQLVTVDNMPANQLVTVDNFPDFPVTQIVAGTVKNDATGSFNGLAPITFDIANKIVPENALRKKINIKAALNNTGLVWVGAVVAEVGIPLEAGESAEFEVTTELQLFCSVATDRVYLAEVIQ